MAATIYTVLLMSPYVVGGLIGVFGTLLVWCLTTVRDHLAEKQRRREYDRAILKGALADYLAALDSVTLEVMDQPPTPVPNAVDRGVEWFLEKLGLAWLVVFVVRILRRIAYGNRVGELTDRMAAASAHLRLVAPPEVLELMQQLDDLFGSQEPRSDAWRADWQSTRENLRAGFRNALNG